MWRMLCAVVVKTCNGWEKDESLVHSTCLYDYVHLRTSEVYPAHKNEMCTQLICISEEYLYVNAMNVQKYILEHW
jgi:hypothetical protein